MVLAQRARHRRFDACLRIERRGADLIATFIALMPMMVASIGLAFGKRPSKLEIVGMVIGFAGVIFSGVGSKSQRVRRRSVGDVCFVDHFGFWAP